MGIAVSAKRLRPTMQMHSATKKRRSALLFGAVDWRR